MPIIILSTRLTPVGTLIDRQPVFEYFALNPAEILLEFGLFFGIDHPTGTSGPNGVTWDAPGAFEKVLKGVNDSYKLQGS